MYGNRQQKKKGPPPRKYGEPRAYEAKLRRVMDRLGAKNVNWDYGRHSAYVSFEYKGQFYRFEHDIEKAGRSKEKLYYGTDCFAQLVRSLEDIARMAERGIYDLQKWIEGMKALPPGPSIPDFLIRLGFRDMPKSEDEVQAAFRKLAKVYHPDKGGKNEDFIRLEEDRQKAVDYLKSNG